MSRQEKIVGELSFRKTAAISGFQPVAKAANYTVVNASDSGKLLIANNSEQSIAFFLPAVNAVNGQVWSFFNQNTGKMFIVGDTNAIVCANGVSIKSVNYGQAGGIRGAGATVWSDGVKYFLVNHPAATNTSYTAGYLEG